MHHVRDQDANMKNLPSTADQSYDGGDIEVAMVEGNEEIVANTPQLDFAQWFRHNQEQKMHDFVHKHIHYDGYPIIYGGIHGQYSGTMTITKDKYKATEFFNHAFSRSLGVPV